MVMVRKRHSNFLTNNLTTLEFPNHNHDFHLYIQWIIEANFLHVKKISYFLHVFEYDYSLWMRKLDITLNFTK